MRYSWSKTTIGYLLEEQNKTTKIDYFTKNLSSPTFFEIFAVLVCASHKDPIVASDLTGYISKIILNFKNYYWKLWKTYELSNNGTDSKWKLLKYAYIYEEYFILTLFGVCKFNVKKLNKTLRHWRFFTFIKMKIP